MTPSAQESDRSHLRFAESVKANFAFLSEHGFRCKHAEPTLVRYSSWTRSISIYHGRLSYEIGLQIGRRWRRTDETYSMYELLSAARVPGSDRYRDYASTTPEGVAQGVRQRAEHLRSCADIGVLAAPKLLEQLREYRVLAAKEYTCDIQLSRARQAAESAWIVKDYAAVVSAFAPVTHLLTGAETKKLEYCRDRVAK